MHVSRVTGSQPVNANPRPGCQYEPPAPLAADYQNGLAPSPRPVVRSKSQTTMVHDGTSHRIFRIGELTMLIASQLTLISPKSTASLACTCRHLEEPSLSSLWQTQPSLDTLLKVLPGETWRCDNPGPGKSVVRGPNPPLENSSA